MTSFIDQNFTQEALCRFQGYHLQVFSSGRAKISLQAGGNSKLDYYAERPKRDKEAYQRQKSRSGSTLAEHFAQVDALLARLKQSYVFRVHAKGDNNKTADNVHVVTSQCESSIWVILGGAVHEWEVPMSAHIALITGTGPRKGVPSIFNEYMPAYEHDWEGATFGDEHYRVGARESIAPSGRERAAAPLVSWGERTSPVVTASESLSIVRPHPLVQDEYPDVGLRDPFEEDEPDPEDWEEAEAEDPFEYMPVLSEKPPVASPTAHSRAGSNIQPYSKDQLWSMIAG